MALAAFGISFEPNVDEDNYVIKGCRLAENGKMATFAGKDGKPIQIRVNPSVINGILGFAEKAGRLDSYWTHDRLNPANKSKDPISDSLGVWRNFSKDASGNLIADLQLEPSEHRERVMWKAKNDPSGIMASLVFEYTGGTEDCVVESLHSGDLVRFGAATTALLSAYPEETLMTKEEIEKLVGDSVKTAIAAFSESIEKPADEKPACEAAEVAAGVTDEDKKPEDEKLPAALCSAIRISRASARLTTATLSAQIEKADGKTAIAAMAELTKQLGTFSKFSAPQGEAKKTTRAQFNAMDHSERNAFISAGGKITD